LKWPEGLDGVWAKSAGRGAGGQPETLAAHTWEVLSRLAEWVHLRPDLPDALGVPRLWSILCWAAWLHDWGKAAGGFQARLRGGARWPHRHEALSLAFVDWVADGFSPDEQAWLVAAIVSHHKDADEMARLYPPPDPDKEGDDVDPLAARVAELDAAMLDGLWRWLDGCAADWVADLGLDALGVTPPRLPVRDDAVAGVQRQGAARVRYWLRVYRRLVRRLARAADPALTVVGMVLRGHVINADHGASAHAGALPRVTLDAGTVLSSRGLAREDLFRHQVAAAETTGSALLTAPTGSGKTEAALLWAARQVQTGGAPARLFYTLPYQASMNAMKLRLEGSFGAEQVGLQHGRGLLALYRMLLERDADSQAAARQAKRMRDLVRLNYPPVRVFSPYQMLKAMYRLRGYEALLSDYYGALFVFDEIHAYEVQRLALILKSIAYLARHYGARFLIMSATFPTLIKDWLRQALGEAVEIGATPALFRRFRRHRLCLLAGELLSEAGLARVAADARAGRSVLVVCNLVDRAQAVYTALQERLAGDDVPLVLLHGRFTGRDRLEKEALVRRSVGATRRTRQPIVLVATQVVEVSLDIDLDTIYTDPAPLEALVQRFGRVNRRGHLGLAPVHVYRQPDDGQYIYDADLVAGALAVLAREDQKPLDEGAVGCWLDEIYAGTVAARWQTAYVRAADEFEAACLQTLRPFQADALLEDLFYRAFDGLEVLPASLYDAYQALQETEPIRAGELLVPISWGRYHALSGAGLVLPRAPRMPYVVDVPYSAETGLTFDAPPEEEDDLWG
jgi:CRISPR-associated endonuclease/helicase Cas3